MKVELISQTHTANIYGVYEDSLKPIGTVQCTLCGTCETIAYSLTGKYTRKQILGFYNKTRKDARR